MSLIAETVKRPSSGDDRPALMMVGQKGKEKMTNYEFLKSEKATLQDMLQLATNGCRSCIYRGKFRSCTEAGVHCDSGTLLWLRAEHKEEEEKND